MALIFLMIFYLRPSFAHFNGAQVDMGQHIDLMQRTKSMQDHLAESGSECLPLIRMKTLQTCTPQTGRLNTATPWP
jgi:hypothetical protein